MWSGLEILTIVVATVSGISTFRSAVIARDALARAKAAHETALSALRFQVLTPALFEYRSPEMLLAIREVWDFARTHSTGLAEAYQARWKSDRETLIGLSGQKRLDHLRSTLDFQRRQVSHFYSFLCAVYDEQGALRKWIYTNWGKHDLAIIPEAIIPMENALSKSTGVPVFSPTLERLQKLYDDCPTFHKEPKGSI